MAADSLFTLADLKQQVCLNIGAVDDVTQSKSEKWINRALIRFSEFGIWSWQKGVKQAFPGPTSVTVAGQGLYSIPNCLELHSLYFDPAGTNWGKITLMDLREFRRRYASATANGRPYLYLESGRANSATLKDVLKVTLYPTPDAAYTLMWDGIKPITLLTSSTQDVREITGMPVNMVDILIELATEIGWREMNDMEDRPQMQEVLARTKGMFNRDSHSIEDVHVMRGYDEDDYYRDPVLPPQYTRN